EEDAWFVARLARDLPALAGGGGMLSLPLPAEVVSLLLQPYGGRISVAAVDGHSSMVFSGDADTLEPLLADHERARRIDVYYASHSADVEAIREEILTALPGVTPRPAQVPFYST
ncbi:hypothetical protein VM98_35915, partial [Streptomyces rubellomurinus subsp. indigoferus]